MRILTHLYDKVIHWSKHPYAIYVLSGVSFIESSFFPIPPDVMLITMTLAKRHKAWMYVAVATIFSVLGGLFGYLIGLLFIDIIYSYIVQLNYEPYYLMVNQWFEVWGFWVMFIAGFSPIPYKLFTIAAGAIHFNIALFVLASIISRGARFLLVTATVYWQGERVEKQLRKYSYQVLWISLSLMILFLLYRLF